MAQMLHDPTAQDVTVRLSNGLTASISFASNLDTWTPFACTVDGVDYSESDHIPLQSFPRSVALGTVRAAYIAQCLEVLWDCCDTGEYEHSEPTPFWEGMTATFSVVIGEPQEGEFERGEGPFDRGAAHAHGDANNARIQTEKQRS